MKEKRRKKIEGMLQEFIQQFSMYGMDKTTIKMLATAVDCNEALLYQYFEDKDDMIEKCTEYHHEKIENELSALWLQQIGDLKKLGEKTIKYLDSVMEPCRFIMQVIAHPEYSDCAKETGMKEQDHAHEFVEELQKIYSVTEEGAMGIALGINSFVNNYILRPDKKCFFLQYNALTAVLQKAA